MPRYIVELRKIDKLEAEVEVEADSPELAKSEAYRRWEQDFDNHDVCWDVMEEACEVVGCEPVNEDE